MSFNLKAVSDNTFLTSNIQIKDLIQFALKEKSQFCALIDKNNMFGAAEFYFSCLAANIKPIIGVELSIKYGEEIYPLILIAKSGLGYKNITTLTSKINHFDTTFLQMSELSLYSQDVICVISSEDSQIAKYLKNNQIFEANNYLELLQSMFQEIYFGIYRYKGVDDSFLLLMKEYALNHSLTCIALQYAFHKNAKDTFILNLLDSIKYNKPLNKDFLSIPSCVEGYLKNNIEMKVYYDQDELTTLDKVANSCHVVIEKVKFSLPDVYPNTNSDEMLRKLAFEGLKKKDLEQKEDYLQRFEYELSIIEKMGFSSYFLVVADYVNYGKNHDVPIGPARGSGGASLIAYLLNITTIDPLKYHLLFERFLNPYRANYPDFDIDFSDVKRDQVLEYIQEKYGVNHVAHIATFATLGPKSAMRDVARVLKMSSEDVDYIVKKISSTATSLNEEYKHNEPFKNLVDIHPNYKTLVTLASQIEGLKRQVGIHAAGMIISKDSLEELLPCFQDGENSLVIQYDYVMAEKLGFIKMDFLGLKNLSIIDFCFKQIEKIYHKTYNIETYPFDHPSTYFEIASLNLYGIFQLESEGMKNMIEKACPSCFSDIVDLIALYRPGSINNVDLYIENKNHPEKITYIDDRLIPILKPTYGVILYQEQILQILQVLANYSVGEADIFRRAISKKKAAVMAKEKETFLKRCVENQTSEQKARDLFTLIEKFAEYGFNKAHSVGYSVITCIMSSLKASYPAIFYQALLIINGENGSKKMALINEAKKHQVVFTFPSINESLLHFTVKENTIRFGLADISSIKENVAMLILQEREKGSFNSLEDFLIRMKLLQVSYSIVFDIACSGALDEFKIPRLQILSSLELVYEATENYNHTNYQRQSFSREDDFLLIPLPKFNLINPDIDCIKKEFEMLGVYLSEHPLSKLKEKLKKKFVSLDEVTQDNYTIHLVKVSAIEMKKSKKNTPYLSLKVEDEMSLKSINYYRDDASTYYQTIHKGDIVEISLKKNKQYLNLYSMKKVEE